MKETEYSRISSAPEPRDSTSASEDDGLLPEKTPSIVSSRRTRNFIIGLSLLNLVLFSVSTLLFGTWFYNNYLVLNARFRRVSSYSKISVFESGTHQTDPVISINFL